MKRIFYLAYGLIAYLAFLGTILYAIGFLGNTLIPKTLDGATVTPLWKAIIVNGAIIVLVAKIYVLSSTLAIRKWWIRTIPEPLKRISFVLLVSLLAMAVMWFWQPMGGIVWKIENEALQSLIMVLYLSGWMIVFASTFLINHFELFGIRQVWLYYKGWDYESLVFRLPVFYKIVRHPLYIGILIAIWSASTMTVAHLLLSVLSMIVILKSIQTEDRTAASYFGQKTSSFRKLGPSQLPMERKKAKV